MQMTVSLADYGVGNLHSIKKSLEGAGADVRVVTDMKDLIDAKCIVFPGVGAFDKTMEKLQPYRDRICDLLDSGIPAMGICVGAQILFENSTEGRENGLGFIPGKVEMIKAKQIPHMGWNSVESDDALFDGTPDNFFYFAHSYCGNPPDRSSVIGTTEYENQTIPTFFRRKNVYGCQFHPEKSSISGSIVIRNFIKFAETLQ